MFLASQILEDDFLFYTPWEVLVLKVTFIYNKFQQHIQEW